MQEISSICSHAPVQGTVAIIIAIIGPEADQTKQSMVGQQMNKCLLKRQNKGQVSGQMVRSLSPND